MTDEKPERDDSPLQHDRYGRFEDHPHAEIDMSFSTWLDAAQEAVRRRVGPPCGYHHDRDDGTLYLWREHLTEVTLRMLADACNKIESEHADMGLYDGAKAAERAASRFTRAEIQQPAEVAENGN